MIVLNIFLTILKIIGIALAIIVALILFVILSVLLYPVKYKGSFTYRDKCVALIKASWLYHIVTLKIAVCGSKRKICIKVFGIKFGHSKKRIKKRTKKVKSESIPDKLPEALPESSSYAEPEVKPVSEKRKKMAKMPKKKSFKERFIDFKSKIVYYKSRRDEMLSKIKDESNQKAVSHLWKVLIKLIKHLRPKKHMVDIIYGSGDPASTGKHLGNAYALGAVLGINLCVTPDFDNKIFECRAAFKGRIYLIYPVMLFLKAYKDEHVKHLIKKIKE